MKDERQRQGLTLRELAHFCDCSHVTILRLEAGTLDAAPALRARIARALRVPVAELWPREGAEGEAAGGKGVNSEPAAA